MNRFCLASLCLVLAASIVPARADAVFTSTDRINLLASDTEYLYWSPDAADPEMGKASFARSCGFTGYGRGDSQGCTDTLQPTTRTIWHDISFLPGVALSEPIEFSVADPLRFHFEMSVIAAAPYTVHLVLERNGLIESPAATEVAPNVWEGTLAQGSPIDPATGWTMMRIRIKSVSHIARVSVQTRGRSYISLPRSIDAAGVTRRPGEHVRAHPEHLLDRPTMVHLQRPAVVG